MAARDWTLHNDEKVNTVTVYADLLKAINFDHHPFA
jgi:hypothetical protein